jgi:hypothetical protein
MQHTWAKEGKQDFQHDPFPVEALHTHMQHGSAAGELWLQDTLVVALGMHTMQQVAELATLHVSDMTWLLD